jgi:hypothetical protein
MVDRVSSVIPVCEPPGVTVAAEAMPITLMSLRTDSPETTVTLDEEAEDGPVIAREL